MPFSKTTSSSITDRLGDSIDYAYIEIKDVYYTNSLEDLQRNQLIQPLH